VEKSLKVESLQYQSADFEYLSLNLQVDNPPLPLAYDIFMRLPGGKEEKLAGITLTGSTGYGTGGHPKKHVTAQKVDLVFRPSVELARNTVTMTRMWNGEVILKDVPLKQAAEKRK